MAVIDYGQNPTSTFEILLCIDMSESGEYWSMDDKLQHEIDMMLMCGHLDMTPNGSCWNKLFSIFTQAERPITYAALKNKFKTTTIP